MNLVAVIELMAKIRKPLKSLQIMSVLTSLAGEGPAESLVAAAILK
jgi:hypothetical protein